MDSGGTDTVVWIRSAAASLTRIANKPKPCVGRFAPIRRTKPRNTKPAFVRRAGVPAKPGNIDIVADPILPENLIRRKPVFGPRRSFA